MTGLASAEQREGRRAANEVTDELFRPSRANKAAGERWGRLEQVRAGGAGLFFSRMTVICVVIAMMRLMTIQLPAKMPVIPRYYGR